MSKSNEEWGSRIGIILVVASGAIGLGNFYDFRDRLPNLAEELSWFLIS